MSQRAGWYDDPENPENLRYFDGVLWTSHTAPRTSPSASQSTIGRTQPSSTSTQQLPYGGRQDAGQPGGGQPGGGQPGGGEQDPGPQRGGQQDPGPQHPYGAPPSYPYGPQPYASMPQGYAGALGVKTTPDGVPLASYGQRVGAYLLDMLILGVLNAILGGYWLWGFVQWYATYVTTLVNQTGAGGTPTVDQAQVTAQVYSHLVPVLVIGLVLQVLYQTLFLVRWGATPGKMALGIAVRRRDRPGNVGVVDALRRQAIQVGSSVLSVVPVIGAVIGFVPILDLLWPLWDDKRQALHDKLAGTNVVVRRRER